MSRRKRRNFTPEFKAETVRLVRDSGRSIPAIAKELDLTETCLRNWIAEDAAGKAGALSANERQELESLRRDVRRLRMERDILKKATVASTGECNTMCPERRTCDAPGIETGFVGYRT